MKGVILAGGLGTRLRPLTLITNKHLLPVYDKPMILYPLETLRTAGIKEIMVVCGKEYAGHFMNFLGSGKDHGVKLSYALQHGSGGIAEALSLAEDFVGDNKVVVILGDNIFEDNFEKETKKFEQTGRGIRVFLKSVKNPGRFGVPCFSKNSGKILKIEEKPKRPKSNYAVTGIYFYNPDIFYKIKRLKASARGELEITDAHNTYLKKGELSYGIIKGFWSDAGTFNSLVVATNWAAGRSVKDN